MNYDKETLLKEVLSREQNEVKCLQELVAVPTCYGKKHDMQPMISLLREVFEKKGYKVQIFPTSGAPVFVAEMNRSMEKTLMFYNHYDVQPEEPLEEWKSPPYSLSTRDNRLFGRGVSDNKGPLVANLFGFESSLEAGFEPKCNVRFIVEGEEEAGSVHFGEFCTAHYDLLRSDGCVWESAIAVPNQSTQIFAGVKGDVYFELSAKGFAKDAHSGDAPIVVNPAWRLVWALSTLKNEKEEILIPGFCDEVVPPKKEELELFASYPPEEVDKYRQLYSTDMFLLGREGVEFWKHLILMPTCTISGLLSGYTGSGPKTVVGKEAIAKLDFRIVPNQKVREVEKLLRQHLDSNNFPDIDARLLVGYEPSRTPIDSHFIRLLRKLAKDFSGKEAVLIPSSQGSGPAYLFGPYTPWASCDTSDPETNVHAPNESIRLNDLRYMTAFIGALAIELGR